MDFYEACEYGHIEIVKSMFEKAEAGAEVEATKLRINWESGFLCACRGGNMEVVRLIIEKSIENNVKLNYNSGLITHACRGGNIDTINLIIEKCIEHNVKIKWDHGLCGACRGGHMEIVKLMIENGSNDWNWGLHYACEGGHAVIIDLMLVYGANIEKPFPKQYTEYKQAQALKFTKLHESLIDLVLTNF